MDIKQFFNSIDLPTATALVNKVTIDDRPISPNGYGLDADEMAACEWVACDEPEVAEALQMWSVLSARGRDRRTDEALLDRLEYFLRRAIEREANKHEPEGLEDNDAHELGGIGA